MENQETYKAVPIPCIGKERHSMAGIIGIIASLTVLGVSMVVIRLASIALHLTGLSWELASFQARSAFTGTGFTTGEAEKIMGNPARRKIITWLMIARSAGFVSIIISLILSFGSNGDDPQRLVRLLWLLAGVCALWFLARSRHIEIWMNQAMKKALGRWQKLKILDFTELLNLSGEYCVRELPVEKNDWLAHKNLARCSLNKEGILILGIHRDDGSYVGVPRGETQIYPGDTLVLYGREKTIYSLGKRSKDSDGETAHHQAVDEQNREKAAQVRQEKNYEQKRRKKNSDRG